MSHFLNFSDFSDIFVFKIQCMLVNVHVLNFSDTHFITTRSSICTRDTIFYPKMVNFLSNAITKAVTLEKNFLMIIYCL